LTGGQFFLQNKKKLLTACPWLFVLLAAIIWPSTVTAQSTPRETVLRSTSGEELNVEVFPAQGSQAIIWTPSGFGTQAPQKPIALGLANKGVEVWIPDLHTSYFLTRGRNSVEAFPPGDISDLIDLAAKQGKKEIYLMSSGRGAIAALRAARVWQQRNPGNYTLRGLVLFHPSMYTIRPALGEKTSYVPIAYASNLPIYIIQSQLSTTYTRLPDLLNALRSGGSQVFVHSLPDVKDGFHQRPDSHLGKSDLTARKELPDLVTRAINMLAMIPLQENLPPLKKTSNKKQDTLPGLKPYMGNLSFPTLELKDMQGVVRKLADFKGKIVLISFWATWCPPCVREIPSMNKLYADMDKSKFEILAVNIGEKKSIVKKFLKQNKIDFPVLLDTNKKYYLEWKVYVVPSNYLVDKNGKLIAGSVGAIDWQAKETIEKIKNLIKK